MRKVYYKYNPKTRSYDRVYPTFRQRVVVTLRRAVEMLLLGCLAFLVYYLLIQTPSVNELQQENARLLTQYNILSHRMDEAMEVLVDMQQRDDNLYRVILEADPVSDNVRRAGYGGTNRYREFMDMDNVTLVTTTTQKMDMLSKQLYMQIRSFDDLVELCKGQEDFLRCIPAIQPVSNRNLKQMASGYGWRLDPVYKIGKMHTGMDFSCDVGTSVYATGDGTVVEAKWNTGYGNTVVIDHGHGYRTRYAHLHKMKVRPGAKVVRGEEIALSGSTGKSTGPHVHYEVEFKGRKVNPVNYYFMDLDAEGYDQMVQMAENHGKVFD